MGLELGFDGGLNCAHSVRDLEKAIQWYSDHLGFTHLYTKDEMGWCEMATPIKGVKMGLSQVEEVEPKGGATLTWGVQDIDKARSALESRDVPFDGDTIRVPGMVALATFYDPDGNKMMLYEDLGGQ